VYEYECTITRAVDGDTLCLDISLGFRAWLHGVQVRLSDVSAPEKNTPDGQVWRNWWLARIAEGCAFRVRTVKDPGMTFSRWLGSISLRRPGSELWESTADLLDPNKERRFKHEGLLGVD
jgi:hypothetical protein